MDSERQGGENLREPAWLPTPEPLGEGHASLAPADWRAMCLELALLVDKHRRERMMEDRKAAWRMARDILEIEEKMDSR